MEIQNYGLFMDLHNWIMEIHSWIMDIHNWIMEIHNWIMEIHKWIMEIHNWIMEIHNWNMEIHNYGVGTRSRYLRQRISNHIPPFIVGCNYLSLPEISAFGTKVLLIHRHRSGSTLIGSGDGLNITWRHQVITWTNVDLSAVKLRDNHLRAIS